MAGSAQYTTTPRFGTGVVSIGDVSRTSPLQPVTVFTAGASGSRIDRVVFQALGTTAATTLRLWKYDGATYSLWQELSVSAATPTSSTLAATGGLSVATTPTVLPLVLPTGYSLRATLNDTQFTQAAQIDSITASGTINGVVTLGNSKFTVTAASTAAVSALATQAGAAFLSLTATPYVPAQQSVITLTSTGNISAVNFTITGTDATGATISEVIAGPNNNTVYSIKSYASVLSVFCSAAVGTNTSVGIASSVNFTTLPTKFTISSATNVSAVTFTIRGIAADGTQLTETIAGPTAGGVVTTANTYKAVTYVSSGSSAATTALGTPAIMTPINVHAYGGDF